MAAAESPTAPSDSGRPLQAVDRYGHLIRVKPEYEERYVVLHAHPFPGLIERMQEVGLRNYSIFLRDHTLFAYYEYVGNDFEADMGAMAEDETVQDWWTLTDPMQEPFEAREEGEWWAEMEELYHGAPRSIPASNADRVAFASTFREGTLADGRQAYADVEGDLKEALEKAHIQNYAVYLLGRRCFTYLEHAGQDLEKNLNRIRQASVMQALQSKIDPLLISLDSSALDPKRPRMESVFFMA